MSIRCHLETFPSCTYQIHVDLQFPELVIHYLCVVHHDIDVIKLGKGRLESLCNSNLLSEGTRYVVGLQLYLQTLFLL